jgi:RNA polymerase sigma-70 factor (ECF subfamily)
MTWSWMTAAAPDDLTAQTFLTCWQRFEVVPDPALPWLYGVARRHLANEWRRRQRRDLAVADPASLCPKLAAPAADLEAIERADASLAAAMGSSRAAARVRLYRARRRLRALLESGQVDPGLETGRLTAG